MGRIHIRNSTQFLFQVVLCWLITILCNNATIVVLQVAFTFCLLNYGKKLIAQTIKLVSSVTSLNLEVHSYYVRTRKIDLSLSLPIFERWTSLKIFSYLLLIVVHLSSDFTELTTRDSWLGGQNIRDQTFFTKLQIINRDKIQGINRTTCYKSLNHCTAPT